MNLKYKNILKLWVFNFSRQVRIYAMYFAVLRPSALKHFPCTGFLFTVFKTIRKVPETKVYSGVENMLMHSDFITPLRNLTRSLPFANKRLLYVRLLQLDSVCTLWAVSARTWSSFSLRYLSLPCSCSASKISKVLVSSWASKISFLNRLACCHDVQNTSYRAHRGLIRTRHIFHCNVLENLTDDCTT